MREGAADIPQATAHPRPQLGVMRRALAGGTEIAVEAQGLPTEHQPHHLQLGEEHVELRQLRLARPSQVARRDVNDLVGVAEVRAVHVFRIGICS
jgi:hypothetical protein